jgi:hypothetical protein
MWDFIKYFLSIIGAGAAIVLVIVLLVLAYSFFKPRTKDKGCDTCRFYKLNCTEEPCLYCEDNDCYQRNNLDGQDELE